MSFTHLKYVSRNCDETDPSASHPVKLHQEAECSKVPAGKGWSNSPEGYEMIAKAAYYKAQKRGFSVSDDKANWLEAERELMGVLDAGHANESSTSESSTSESSS